MNPYLANPSVRPACLSGIYTNATVRLMQTRRTTVYYLIERSTSFDVADSRIAN